MVVQIENTLISKKKEEITKAKDWLYTDIDSFVVLPPTASIKLFSSCTCRTDDIFGQIACLRDFLLCQTLDAIAVFASKLHVAVEQLQLLDEDL